jgi:hypothetical protein
MADKLGFVEIRGDEVGREQQLDHYFSIPKPDLSR